MSPICVTSQLTRRLPGRYRPNFSNNLTHIKLRNEPVYAMLGGKVWDKLPVYMTSSNPVNAKNMGFVGAKIPLPYGPADGDNGLLKNIEFVQNWRKCYEHNFYFD